MKIFALEQAGFVGWYRITAPMLALRRRGHKVVFANTINDLAELGRFDVAVWNRQQSQDCEMVTAVARQHGVKVVFDCDDNESFCPVWNPHYHHFWKDGNKTRVLRQEVRNINAAGMVTVSTGLLAEDLRWFNERVAVLRNQIEPRSWKNAEKLFHSERWIGFFGSNTHSKPIKSIVPALTNVLERHQDVVLVVSGYPEMVKFFPTRVRNKIWTRPFVPDQSFKSWMKSCDVLIRPAANDRFTLAKSENPVLEAGIVNVPILVSESIYGEFVRDADCGHLVCKGVKEWEEKLDELLQSDTLREKYGALLHDWVLTERTYDKNIHKWEEAYDSCRR